MSILPIAKAAVSLATSIGVGTIASNLIKNVAPKAISPIMRGCVWVGTFVVAGAASVWASRQAEQQFDDAVNKFKELTN